MKNSPKVDRSGQGPSPHYRNAPAAAATDLRLTLLDRVYLAWLAGHRRGECRWGAPQTAVALGCSERAVRDSRKRLEACGWIEVTRSSTDNVRVLPARGFVDGTPPEMPWKPTTPKKRKARSGNPTPRQTGSAVPLLPEERNAGSALPQDPDNIQKSKSGTQVPVISKAEPGFRLKRNAGSAIGDHRGPQEQLVVPRPVGEAAAKVDRFFEVALAERFDLSAHRYALENGATAGDYVKVLRLSEAQWRHAFQRIRERETRWIPSSPAGWCKAILKETSSYVLPAASGSNGLPLATEADKKKLAQLEAEIKRLENTDDGGRGNVIRELNAARRDHLELRVGRTGWTP